MYNLNQVNHQVFFTVQDYFHNIVLVPDNTWGISPEDKPTHPADTTPPAGDSSKLPPLVSTQIAPYQ